MSSCNLERRYIFGKVKSAVTGNAPQKIYQPIAVRAQMQGEDYSIPLH